MKYCFGIFSFSFPFVVLLNSPFPYFSSSSPPSFLTHPCRLNHLFVFPSFPSLSSSICRTNRSLCCLFLSFVFSFRFLLLCPSAQTIPCNPRCRNRSLLSFCIIALLFPSRIILPKLILSSEFLALELALEEEGVAMCVRTGRLPLLLEELFIAFYILCNSSWLDAPIGIVSICTFAIASCRATGSGMASNMDRLLISRFTVLRN